MRVGAALEQGAKALANLFKTGRYKGPPEAFLRLALLEPEDECEEEHGDYGRVIEI